MPPPGDLVYFLHIPKTSGSSVRTFLVKAFGEQRVAHVIWDELVTNSRTITPDIRVVTGHLGGLLPLWVKRWPRIITMLRDPVARALSHINHVQRDVDHLLHRHAAGLGVIEYCAHPVLRKTVDNFQSRYLASLSFSRALVPPPADVAAGWPHGDRAIRFENALYAFDRPADLYDEAVQALGIIDATGLCEAHGASLELFVAVLGLDPGDGFTQAHDNVASGGLRVEQLSRREVAALEQVTDVDRAVYAHARTLFADICRKKSIALDAAAMKRLQADS
jgi:hypothetical protein